MTRHHHVLVASAVFCAIASFAASPSLADEFNWTGQGDTENWYSRHFTGQYDSEHRAIYVNNWGRIGIDPPTPGTSDNATIGGTYNARIDWTNTPGILNLSVGAPASLYVANGGSLTVHGSSILNLGQIHIAYGGMAGGGILQVDNATVSGGGTIVFNDAGTLSGSLTLEAGNVIHGNGGKLTAAMLNRGLVNADVNNSWLRLETNAKTNEGVFSASSGGRLEVYTAIAQTPLGQMMAGDNSTVQYFSGSSVSGGTTASSGTGRHLISGQNVTTALSDVTNSGNWLAQDGSFVNLAGSTFTNNGTFEAGGYVGGSGWATLKALTNVTLEGSGDLLMNPGIVDSDTGCTLTNSSTHTIHGRGYLRAALDNQGQVIADYAGSPLSLETNAKTNAGTMKATKGAFLDIKTAITQTSAGQIVADDGSQVRYAGGSSVSGGTTTSSGTGTHLISGQNVTATLTDVTNTGNWLAQDGSFVNLAGSTFTNNGTFTAGGYVGGSGWATLKAMADVTLAGTGQLLMDPGIVDSAAGVTLTNSATHTIHGRGNLKAALDNQGQVVADYTGSPLSLETNAKTNAGTMKATNGAFLDIKTAIAQTPAGQTVAEDGSTVRYYNGSSVSSGTTGSSGTGKHYISGQNVTATLTDVTNNGNWLAQDGSFVNLAGSTFTNNGTFTAGGYVGGSGWATLKAMADVTLAGTGQLLLDPGIVDSAAGATLTNSSTHTIHGRGYLRAALDNQGQIAADQHNSALSLEWAAKTNANMMKAMNGAFLDIKTAITQTPAGQIVAEDGSQVRYAGGSSVSGGTTGSSGTGRHYISGQNVTATLTDVTNSGNWLAENGSFVDLAGSTFTNNGTFELGGYTGGAGWATARPADGLTIQGSGTLLLSPGKINNAAPVTVTNAVGHTIRADNGRIYGNVTVSNLGTLEANAGTLTVDTKPPQFSGTSLTAGTWKAVNGTLSIGGSPSVVTNQADVVLSGSTSVFTPINTLADNQGSFSVLGGRTFNTAGALANSGVLTVGTGSTVAVNGSYTQTAGLTTVDGTLSATGGLALNGGELAGTGTVSGPVMIGAGFELSPGHSAGVLSFQQLALGSGAVFNCEIDGPTADRIEILGSGNAFTLASGGTFMIDLSVLNPVGVLDQYTLFHWAGDDPVFAGTTWVVTGVQGAAGQVSFLPDLNSIVLTDVVVPEPASICLLCAGAVAIFARRRR